MEKSISIKAYECYMNKKYFYKYAISKQQQIQKKESNHLFQVALLFFLPQKSYLQNYNSIRLLL